MMRRRVATVETPSSGSGSESEDDNNKDNKQSTARAAEALEKSYATSTSETSGERAALEKALPEANGNGAPTPTPPPSSEEPRGDWRSASGGDAPVAMGRDAAAVVAEAPGGKWNRFRTYGVLQRTLEIWKFAVVFAFRLFKIGKKGTYKKMEGGMTPENQSAKKRELAIWLRAELLRLGPTFIKVGQQFSTRVDLLSKEYLQELEKLQDKVPPFDSEKSMEIIKTELGDKFDDFASIEKEPFSAASLGQVHLARLKKNNELVVIKVQRPGLKSLFDVDLKNLRVLAKWFQAVDPKTDGAARDWVAIYDECARILYDEIDYRVEAANCQQFKDNFAGADWIKVPQIQWDYTCERVLVMEYCPGLKINDAEGIDKLGFDRKELAKYAVESYLQQVLRHGFFHADPHPGNIAVDKKTGQIIFYDFGMMGALQGDVKGGLRDLFYSVYEDDVDKALDALVAMGILVPSADRVAVRRTGRFFLKSFRQRLIGQKKDADDKGTEYEESFKPQRTKEEKAAKRKEILNNIGEDLLAVGQDQPFRFPASLTFCIRAFTVLDGIGKSLEPRFDFGEIARPYARELVLDGGSSERLRKNAAKAFGRQNRAVANLFKGPNMIEDMSNTIKGMEQGDIKVRVRALEAERALQRVALTQGATIKALVATMLMNVGTVLSASVEASAASALASFAARAAFTGAGALGLLSLVSLLKVKKLESKEKSLTA